MIGDQIISEIVKQGMVRSDEEEPNVLIWKANAPEQLEAVAGIGRLDEALELLRKWQKWADMGVGDFLPEWMGPVMDETYEATRDFLG